MYSDFNFGNILFSINVLGSKLAYTVDEYLRLLSLVSYGKRQKGFFGNKQKRVLVMVN